MRVVYVNPELCIGCLQCEYACAVEHSVSKDEVMAWAEQPVPRARIHVEPGAVAGTSFPGRCRHCDPAPCVQVCPTSALTRSAADGLVLCAADRCIACAMCAMVCPFDALTFHPVAETGPDRAVAVKCDGCVARVRRGEVPACVEACKVGALVYGELDDLVAEGRLGDAAVALAAAGQGRLPAGAAADAAAGLVSGWRAWGADAVRVGTRAGAVEGGGR